jgi:hypothetical protein
MIIFRVHIDDIISATSSLSENEWFKERLKSQWDISDLRPVKYMLGIAISRDLGAKVITLSQTALIDRIVDQFKQTNAQTANTPMVTRLQLTAPDKTLPIPREVTDWIERTPYHSLIGSLMYIAVGTQPDISYAVGKLSSFLDCYRSEHWEAAIHIVRYLKGTRTLGLRLGGTNKIRLIGYLDSDYANCIETSWSIARYCFTLGSGMISWCL